jgi:hypothetical protein
MAGFLNLAYGHTSDGILEQEVRKMIQLLEEMGAPPENSEILARGVLGVVEELDTLPPEEKWVVLKTLASGSKEFSNENVALLEIFQNHVRQLATEQTT